MDNASPEELEKLKRLTGIPHLPTQLTYECRKAVSGQGPRAYDWSDKPHRLIYDLCREIEATAARRPALPDREAVAKEIRQILTEKCGGEIDAATASILALFALSAAPKVTPPQKEWMGLAPSTTHNITIPEFPKVTK